MKSKLEENDDDSTARKGRVEKRDCSRGKTNSNNINNSNSNRSTRVTIMTYPACVLDALRAENGALDDLLHIRTVQEVVERFTHRCSGADDHPETDNGWSGSELRLRLLLLLLLS